MPPAGQGHREARLWTPLSLHHWAYCNCIMTRGGEYNEILPFPRAQAIFYCIPQLESQYSHSQLPLLANIFLQYFLVLAS